MFNQKLNKHTNTNHKSNQQKRHRKSTIYTLVALTFVLVLLSSIAYTTFHGTTPFASATYTIDRTVNDAQELRDAVDTALGLAPAQYVIALANDIVLTNSTLSIPANANIVLTSESSAFMKLIGPDLVDTITVAGGGTLVLDTHLTKEAF